MMRSAMAANSDMGKTYPIATAASALPDPSYVRGRSDGHLIRHPHQVVRGGGIQIRRNADQQVQPSVEADEDGPAVPMGFEFDQSGPAAHLHLDRVGPESRFDVRPQ